MSVPNRLGSIVWGRFWCPLVLSLTPI